MSADTVIDWGQEPQGFERLYYEIYGYLDGELALVRRAADGALAKTLSAPERADLDARRDTLAEVMAFMVAQERPRDADEGTS